MKGKIIVIEGLDGAGKSTQLELLKKKFEERGFEHKYIHFPMLNKGEYGTLIAEFLRGEYGSIEQVHPKLVALLFANDRKEHIHQINEWVEKGYVVLTDRYVNSNIAFQCAKLENEDEKTALRKWILRFEFEYNQLPLPDKTFFLDVPFSAVINSLSKERTGEDRDYLKGKKDIHEASISFQEKVYKEYKLMVKEQENFTGINCSDKYGNFLPPEEINQMIMKIIDNGKLTI